MHAHWDSDWKISLLFITSCMLFFSTLFSYSISLSRINFHKNKHSTSEIKIIIMANFVFISRLWCFNVI